MIEKVCVFCGSRTGHDGAHAAAARALGRGLAQAGMTLIYGGGNVGLMGEIADAAVALQGRVEGIIPDALLAREVGKRDIAELVITQTMFERKEVMLQRADAFVCLPGGLGTLDELFEVVTLRQLSYHDKPILLVDIAGFWQPFITLYDRVIEEGFAASSTRSLFQVTPDVEATLSALRGEKRASA